jgi:hypothetical protein
MSKCIHAKLQLQLVVPEECFVPGDMKAWYKCIQCGKKFKTDLKLYKLKIGIK